MAKSGKASGVNANQARGGSGRVSEQELTMLNNLGDSRSEIRSALETLDVGTSFYNVIESRGEVLRSDLITKTGDDSFTISGQARDTFETTKFLRDFDGAKQAQKPDTSSHVKITGKKAENVGGMKFKAGTYDTLVNKRKGLRKTEQTGKITTYDGVQYGVAKIGGEYITTHIPTGYAIGAGQKSMSGAASQIKDLHKSINGRTDLRRIEERFKNTLRGD